MTNRKIGFSSGFTIIEVALVLAIAGLIFLVVFLALPALQNSQADTARREDVGRVISALQSYEADNGGDVSQSLGSSLGSYYDIGGGIGSKELVNYVGNRLSQANEIIIWTTGTSGTVQWLNTVDDITSPSNTIGISLDHRCSDLGLSSSSSSDSTSQAAVWYLLTNGKDYCVDM